MVFITCGVPIPEENGSNQANQEELDSYHFLFLFGIPYISEEK